MHDASMPTNVARSAQYSNTVVCQPDLHKPLLSLVHASAARVITSRCSIPIARDVDKESIVQPLTLVHNIHGAGS